MNILNRLGVKVAVSVRKIPGRLGLTVVKTTNKIPFGLFPFFITNITATVQPP